MNLIGKQEGQTAIYGVVVLRNLTWPGAATVAFRGGFANIYVGYGQRANQENKVIKELGEIQIEGIDVQEKPEPNPSKVEEKPEVPVEQPADDGN